MDDCAFLTRGTAQARIVSPAGHPLTIASAGWSPGTNGVLRGPVVYFEAKTKGDFEKFRGKLKGAIVIYQEPESLSAQAGEFEWRADSSMQQPPPVKGQPPAPSPFTDASRSGAREKRIFQAAKALRQCCAIRTAARPVQHDRHRPGRSSISA